MSSRPGPSRIAGTGVAEQGARSPAGAGGPGRQADAPPSGESVFVEAGEAFLPTQHATGPWDPGALHGGAPAALIASAFERMQADAGLRIGRLSFQFLRPVPTVPLTLDCTVVRPGRRVQELSAELREEGGQLVCRAKALGVRPVPDDVEQRESDATMPGPESGQAVRFALDDPHKPSFASSAMEMRWITDPWALGPGQVWMRLRLPLLPGQSASPLARLAATSDFGNGVSSELRFDRYIFINADLTIHLQRQPSGEWIGLDARTLLYRDGSGLSESVLHDAQGPVGRAFQTLVVQGR